MKKNRLSEYNKHAYRICYIQLKEIIPQRCRIELNRVQYRITSVAQTNYY